jgi:hypothetical protein
MGYDCLSQALQGACGMPACAQLARERSEPPGQPCILHRAAATPTEAACRTVGTTRTATVGEAAEAASFLPRMPTAEVPECMEGEEEAHSLVHPGEEAVCRRPPRTGLRAQARTTNTAVREVGGPTEDGDSLTAVRWRWLLL